MSTTRGTFATRLRTAREAAALSQYALAKRSGLSKQAVSNLELGNREPTWETVQLLAAALGVDCRAFTDPTVKPPAPAAPKPRGRPPKAKPADAAPEAAPAKKGRRKKGQ